MTQEQERSEREQPLNAAVLAVHGARLDEGQREILRQHIARLRQAAAGLNAYRLENADEPDFAFEAVDRTDAV